MKKKKNGRLKKGEGGKVLKREAYYLEISLQKIKIKQRSYEIKEYVRRGKNEQADMKMNA